MRHHRLTLRATFFFSLCLSFSCDTSFFFLLFCGPLLPLIGRPIALTGLPSTEALSRAGDGDRDRRLDTLALDELGDVDDTLSCIVGPV